MTTATDTSPVEHTSDATFRAWGSSISALFSAVGLVQTADTGQVNWLTATRPSINTAPHYEIWRMNDSQQASAPIYFKIDYGTFNVADRVAIFITFGTGSNGSGTITSASSRLQIIGASNGAGTGSFTSYAAAGEGYFNLFAKGTSAANFWISLSRSSDSSGTPNAVGWTVSYGGANSGPHTQMRSVATGFLSLASGTQGCLVPGSLNSSLVSGDYQVFLNWAMSPRMYPLLGSCHVVKSEIAWATTFSVALIGTTPRTYMSSGNAFSSNSFANQANSTFAVAILYE